MGSKLSKRVWIPTYLNGDDNENNWQPLAVGRRHINSQPAVMLAVCPMFIQVSIGFCTIITRLTTLARRRARQHNLSL